MINDSTHYLMGWTRPLLAVGVAWSGALELGDGITLRRVLEARSTVALDGPVRFVAEFETPAGLVWIDARRRSLLRGVRPALKGKA